MSYGIAAQITLTAVAPEYETVTTSHVIIDKYAHQLVIAPGQFDVIVISNSRRVGGGLGIASIGSNSAIGAVILDRQARAHDGDGRVFRVFTRTT